MGFGEVVADALNRLPTILSDLNDLFKLKQQGFKVGFGRKLWFDDDGIMSPQESNVLYHQVGSYYWNIEKSL